MKPSCWPRIVALLLPRNGNFPVFTWKPASRACFSVRPMEPICGSQYVAVGAALAVEGLYFFSGHAAYGDDSFHGGGVRQLRQAGNDIADGVEMRLVGFEEGVGVNEAALEFGLRFFQADIFGERAAADGDQNFFGADGLRFPGFVFVRRPSRRSRLSSPTRLWLRARFSCPF